MGLTLRRPEKANSLTRTMLEGLERAVLRATAEGARALTLVERITPDIILMDAVMPGMDGFETCRRLKANAALAHVPVIFMTGLAEPEHIVEGLEAGGVDYVTKPIVLDVLLAIVVGVIVLLAAVSDSSITLVIAVVVSLLGFLGSASLARLLPRDRR